MEWKNLLIVPIIVFLTMFKGFVEKVGENLYPEDRKRQDRFFIIVWVCILSMMCFYGFLVQGWLYGN